MKTIHLAAPWSFHSVPVTIDYQPGVHEVEDHIHEAAVKAGVHQENSNGGRAAKTGSQSAADAPEG